MCESVVIAQPQHRNVFVLTYSIAVYTVYYSASSG